MSWSSRRAILILTAVAVLGGVSFLQHGQAQPGGKRKKGLPPIVNPGVPGVPGTPGKPVKKEYDLGSLTLPADDGLKDKVEAAMDRIKEAVLFKAKGEKKLEEEAWQRACDTLQSLVGRHEDVFVPLSRTDPTGREIQVYVSVKKEAARLISTMPKEGRIVYEAKFGEKAEGMVKQARVNNDFRQMAQAMSLYLYTHAGAEAANWLATYMLDRAEFQGASRFFMQLILRSGIKDKEHLKDRTLLKAAYAFHHAGDIKGKELVFKELEARGVELKLREETRTAAELKDTIDKMVSHVSLQSASDSPIYRGRPSRNAMLPGGTAFLEAVWKREMIKTEATKGHLKTAETALLNRNMPILSTFFPVTATVNKGEKKVPLLVYRSHWGIHAVDMKSGKFEWDSPSDWSLDRVLDVNGKDRESFSSQRQAYTTWLNNFLQTNVRPQIILENSVLGSLSADSKMVYCIEDLALPPPQHMVMVDPRFGGMAPSWGPKVASAIGHNKLQAFSLEKQGSLKWELGGTDEKTPAALKDTYFLGPPLPLNGRLYVLTEKQQELRLATIDPPTGKVLGLQTLATTKDLKLSQSPLRRTQAAHLAYAEGILVVPTNAGAVFGVDLLSNSLVWAYPYRESSDTPAVQPGVNPGMFPGGGIRPGWVRGPDGTFGPPLAPLDAQWQVTAPIVQDGKVVFTAPDGKGIHCISLRDGTRLWSQPRRDDDLYLAGVFAGKAVVVGRARTRALSLARGDVAWELETGVPSGQGAASAPTATGDIIYYLPISKALATGEPEICAINVSRGLIHAHTRSRKKEVPGNLIFYEGNVLSQTHTEVVAYPQLEVKLAEMNRLVKANPKDPVALTERGDYLLDKGDLPGAIADFRKALANKTKDTPEATIAKARGKLFEAFTEYFQRDFSKAEDYLKEYEEMCKVDLTGKEGAERTAAMAEERRRRANFLCLVGKGREAQNRLVDAFDKYLELGEEAKKDELIQVVDEPSVKAAPDVWSQGRIAAMVRDAKDPKQKKALEDKITARWKTLKATKTPRLEDLRKFVSLFGSLFGVGKEARLALAERLMEDNDVNSLLEAEQQLSLMRGEQEVPEIAARAIEALARLNTRKGLLEDAAFYYRLLGEKYPRVIVDGKKGEEYLEDLATDKRFLPYLDQAGRFVLRSPVKLDYKNDKATVHNYTPTYQFGHSGEALPFFSRNKLLLQMDWSHQLRLHDTSNAEDRWKLSLTKTQFQYIATQNQQPYRTKFNYQTLGHLVVLQLGHMVFGIDPLNKGRVLWERNLSSLPGAAATPPAPSGQPAVDPRDGSVMVAYTDGWMQRLGEAGPLHGGVICLQMRDSLSAIDPVTGRTLWTRSDVNSRCHLFGDEEHIYVVGMGANGGATGSRVFRAYDGVSVRVPEFSNHYERRIRMVGRNILASDTDARGVVTMRIYDVLQGKDLWVQKFAAGSLLLQSEDSRLAGVAEPDGTIRVVDVVTQKEILNSKMDKKHLDKAGSVTLVSDPESLYVAVGGQTDPNLVPWGGGLQSNLMTNAGLRSIPVNGAVYSFNRATGKFHWFIPPTPNQHMVLSQFEDLPCVLFTSRYQVWEGQLPARIQRQYVVARAFAKCSGKVWYDEENVPPNTWFHSIQMDHRSGKVDLTGYQLKVTLTATPK